MPKGMSQVMSMVIAVVIAAALLYFGFKILGKSQQQVSGLTSSGDLEKACSYLGIYIKSDAEDTFVDQIPAVNAKEIGLIFKAACNSEWADNLVDEASKCLAGSGGTGCMACATTSGRCLALKGTNLENALKTCEALKYYYSKCESEEPNNIMSCLMKTEYNSDWCEGTIPS